MMELFVSSPIVLFQKIWCILIFLQKGIKQLGHKSWTYQEGKNRQLFAVEFSKTLLKDITFESVQDKIEYIRGYFDTEGGVSRNQHVRYYLYFAQKNRKDLEQVKKLLEELGILCGIIHNPSKKADPDYWRFFIRAQSYKRFAKIISSWHPVKRQFLREKI